MENQKITIKTIIKKLQKPNLSYVERMKLIEVINLMIENNKIKIKIIEESKKSTS